MPTKVWVFRFFVTIKTIENSCNHYRFCHTKGSSLSRCWNVVKLYQIDSTTKKTSNNRKDTRFKVTSLKDCSTWKQALVKTKSMSCNNMYTSPTVQQIFLKDPNVSVQGIWSKRVSRVTPIPFPHLIAVRTKWHVWVCWRWRFLGTNPCGRQGRLPGVHLCLETERSRRTWSPASEDPCAVNASIEIKLYWRCYVNWM